MTTTISFVMPGKIAGKGRARITTSPEGQVRSYTPAGTRSAEAIIRDLAANAMKNLPLFEGPVEIFINVWRIPPPSWSKKKRATANFITGKPDVDNIQKLICDALNKIVYHDDSQVAVAHIQRRWNLKREEVYVLVRTLDAGSLVDNSATENSRSPVVERNTGERDRPVAPHPLPQNGKPEGVP